MDSLAEYMVFVGGRSRRVKVLRVNHKNTALIELDGKVVEVTLPNHPVFDEQTAIGVNGRTHRIKLRKEESHTVFDVEVDGKQFALQLEAKRRQLGSARARKASFAIPISQIPRREKIVAKKSGAVTSSMPGKVVLLKVGIGDKVRAGDPLCVLEAMKMENEIVAPKEGTITQVKVEQGSTVNKGDVLVVIE